MKSGWRERNQQDATNLMFIIKLLSQHVSGIIMPVIRRTIVCTNAYGVLHWLWWLWLCGAWTRAVCTLKPKIMKLFKWRIWTFPLVRWVDYGVGRRRLGFISQHGEENFLFSIASGTALGPPSLERTPWVNPRKWGRRWSDCGVQMTTPSIYCPRQHATTFTSTTTNVLRVLCLFKDRERPI